MDEHAVFLRLAQEVAPDEAVLSSVILDGWLAGGPRRAELFARSRSMAGSFGAGELSSYLPYILKGITVAGPAILGFLTSEFGRGVIESVKTALSVAEIGKMGRDMVEEQKHGPAQQFETLRFAAETLENELKAGGIPAAQAESAALRAIKALLSDPESAAKFVSRLAESR